jgi:hypothetical protein
MAFAPKFRNWLRTLGAPEDPVATDTSSEWSALSLLKAIYLAISNGSLAAGIAVSVDGAVKSAVAGAIAQVNLAAKRAAQVSSTATASAFQAESFATFVRGAVAQCAQYMRLARASKVAAAASAVLTAADVVTTTEMATTAKDASNFSSGQAMFGQRAKKDRVAAAASAAAAAASAASVATPEALVLHTQVFS